MKTLKFTIFLLLIAFCSYGQNNKNKKNDNPDVNTMNIVGGENTTIEEFPYQVSIRYANNNWEHGCGGTILNSRWIVTAGHCGWQTYPNQLRVVAGVTEKSNNTDGQYINVRRIILHPDFRYFINSTLDLDNDVALLELETPLTFNDKVQPINISTNEQAYLENQLCILTGWGSLTYSPSGPFPEILQKLEMPIISQQQAINQVSSGSNITENMIPLALQSQSGGNRDSGGLLTNNNGEVPVLIGACSWRATDITPVITFYTKLGNYYDWIHDNAPKLEVEGSSYICKGDMVKYSIENLQLNTPVEWSTSPDLRIIGSNSSNTIEVQAIHGTNSTSFVKAKTATLALKKTIISGSPLFEANFTSDFNYVSVDLVGAEGIDLSDQGVTDITWNILASTNGGTGRGRGIQGFFHGNSYNWTVTVEITVTNSCGSTTKIFNVTPRLPNPCEEIYNRYEIVNQGNNVYAVQRIIDPCHSDNRQLYSKEIDFVIYALPTGEIINSKKGSSIDISLLTSGIYVIKAILPDGVATLRIIKN